MIQKQIFADLKKVLQKLRISSDHLQIEHPADETKGDYATNIALKVSAKGVANSWDMANNIVNTWRSSGLPEYLEKIEVAKPGFINLWLKKEFLGNQLLGVMREKDKYGSQNLGKNKAVVIDYSSPNIARSFGVGHLRSTIIGQALYNLYRFLGYRANGINHLGDWGTQFGKLIVAIKRWHKGQVRGLTVDDLEKLYVKFHQEVQRNPELEEEARLWFKKLENKNPEARKIWQACVEISLKEFKRIYELLGIKIDYAWGESFYANKTAAIITEAKRKDLTQESEKALVMPLEGFEVPLMLLKSDGATTYETRDLAALKYRLERFRPAKVVYEVGVEQSLHFQHLFAAARLLGWGKGIDFVHLKHGLYQFEGGKMSTRGGKTVSLEKVLDEAVGKAKKIIENSETSRGLTKKEKEKIVQKVGIGAIKYFDLSHQPQTDIVFDWEKIFVLEGDSAPYLQYTYARCFSVLGKTTKIETANLAHWPIKPEELAILRQIYRFSEIIQKAAETYSPNLLCQFLFDLAQRYNLFYNKWPILKSDKNVREARLMLTAAVAQILKNGLTLLGIEVLERM